MSTKSWKEALKGSIEPGLAREIDVFETELLLRKQGRIEEKLFAETRLRRGAYGQRYDNGKRFDGVATQDIAYPSGALTKGPATLWDAPGMQRIKIPFGGLFADQMDALADLAEEYSDGILHVTTRQDVQLHYVHIDDTPELMRRLAAAGITTREACGNTVRNVTACPYAGVCKTEPFDVTPYAKAVALFLLGHPDTQDFGRKFKIAFSGCRDEACGLTMMHDLGALGVVRREGDKEVRGFEIYVGGGLGAVPHLAKPLSEFVPEEELLPLAQAVCRVFARLGEKKNRARARLKFVVQRLGIEEFKRLVFEERAILPYDARWTSYLDEVRSFAERPRRDPSLLALGKRPDGFDVWKRTNVMEQRQAGYATATIALPLGDLSSAQMRALAQVARKYVGDNVRTTVEQNIVLRWVPESELVSLYKELQDIGLAEPGAGTIIDVTACPGTDTCKLGVSSSRGLAGELRRDLAAKSVHLDENVGNLRIKVSGCFNACGQHHIADLGFWGVQRKVGGATVPHFQVVLGGEFTHNAGSNGLAIGAVPSKNIPKVVHRLTDEYAKGRSRAESFQSWIERTGKAKLRALLEDLIAVPSAAEDPSFYSDWGDPRTYSIGDLGMGECAGEVVPLAQFGLSAAERQVFEGQVLLDQGESDKAAEKAYQAMLQAAEALTRTLHQDVSTAPDELVREFRARLCETGMFHDPFGGDRFAQYLFKVHGTAFSGIDAEKAHRRIEEATLFIEAAHACYGRMSAAPQV
ncbi:MAG: nitrite/sulfite reductase [Polyangiaceae bacterium]